MKNHGLITHVISPARTTPVRGLRRALPADPPIWVARGILITALALGCLGAGATVLPGHADTRLTFNSSMVVPHSTIGPSWMY
jgi:hypothetical protein